MATSKYDRELRFIDVEARRITLQLTELRESMPADPAEAQAKAKEVAELEDRLANLLRRKKEIEDSFIALNMDIPDVHRNLNANIWREGRNYDSTGFMLDEDKPPRAVSEPAGEPAAAAPEGGVEELTQEIESVTDELMGVEIKMLRADMNGEEDEKEKLSMMASSLRSRRDTLVERVKELKAEEERARAEAREAPAADPEVDARIAALEADNRAIRTQLGDVRSDISDVKESLRQILNALNLQ